MSFKIGDAVSVLDEAIEGVVTAFNGDIVTIETSEGFEMDFPSSELIANRSLSSRVFEHADANAVIAEKELTQKPKSKRIKPKERSLPAMEVDLHIHQITTSNKHMSNFDILNLQLDTARHKLEFAIKKRIQKVVFIHGVGEGVLKTELEYLFARYDNVKFYDADYQKYGQGATEVYIYQNVQP